MKILLIFLLLLASAFEHEKNFKTRAEHQIEVQAQDFVGNNTNQSFSWDLQYGKFYKILVKIYPSFILFD